MVCPSCRSWDVEHRGTAKVMMDTLIGVNEYKLDAWECTYCSQVFYTDKR